MASTDGFMDSPAPATLLDAISAKAVLNCPDTIDAERTMPISINCPVLPCRFRILPKLIETSLRSAKDVFVNAYRFLRCQSVTEIAPIQSNLKMQVRVLSSSRKILSRSGDTNKSDHIPLFDELIYL